MGALTHTSVHDAALNNCRDNVSKVVFLSAEPATYAEANGALKLAERNVSPADFTISNGDVSGRKIEVGDLLNVVLLVTGTGDHIAWLDDVNQIVKQVFETLPQAVTANGSNNIDIPAHSHESRDPVSV